VRVRKHFRERRKIKEIEGEGKRRTVTEKE
jgi:hypothetical protein